jgi:hypothetical protein
MKFSLGFLNHSSLIFKTIPFVQFIVNIYPVNILNIIMNFGKKQKSLVSEPQSAGTSQTRKKDSRNMFSQMLSRTPRTSKYLKDLMICILHIDN